MYSHEWIGNDANNVTSDIYIVISLIKVEYLKKN